MCGLSFEEFWGLTLKELNIYLKAMGNKRKRDAEDNRIRDYNLASMVARFTSLAISGKTIPSYAEVFPDTEAAKKQEEEVRKQQMAILTDQWKGWAEAQNRLRAERLRRQGSEN